jgi:hypothetical protein
MMYTLLGAISYLQAQIWYAVPLALVISLVYGATRHEEVYGILEHAWKGAIWVAIFMAGIAAIVWLGGFGVV